MTVFCMFFLMLAVVGSAQDEDRFTIARIKYGGGGDWYVGQTQIPNLLKELRERTNVETASKQVVLQLADKDLYLYPFIYMTGHGNVVFTDKEVEALRLYLIRGGFLWANDDYGMDKRLYHCYYDFPNGLPKIHEHDRKPPRGYGLFYEGRMIVFYDYESDIGDGLENPDVHNDPPQKREQAIRMAINIVIYALTH